ncbi:hypothetical protein [Streptomyces sp. QHH-9511]|uniref:hypothetical protein n=1 Tax=Streptomyces sp. QHH-9511 TaxID=2684468 RepID=UPI001E30D307|nr:hypothetical protein [Streptomyces sp. QHH-9511]
MFIAGIIAVSLIYRVSRTTELRAERIAFDPVARQSITDILAHDQSINIIANRRQAGDVVEYADKEREQRGTHPVPARRRTIPGNLRSRPLRLQRHPHRPPRRSRRLPDPARGRPGRAERHRRDPPRPTRHHRRPAPLLLRLGRRQPPVHMIRYFLIGRGDTAPVTREIIRKHEPDASRRPGIHVGG